MQILPKPSMLVAVSIVVQSYFGAAVASDGPTKSEMLSTMKSALQSRGGNRLGVRVRDIDKLGCNLLSSGRYMCAYRVYFAKGGNPLFDAISGLTNGVAINERVFARYGNAWVMIEPR